MNDLVNGLIMKDYKIEPNDNGEYILGPEKNYILSQKSLRHIIFGEFSSQIIKHSDFDKKTVRLTGGLHTVDGWLLFKKELCDIVHGRFYDPRIHKDWYFSKELQNRVILLKLPLSIFKSRAAKITKKPETYYKSGYLWKTLFPSKFSQADVVAVVNEALHNIDKEETNNNFITGYALMSSYTSVIKICILCHGCNINSAYPSWGQPTSGNFGNPFSSIDSIGFIVSGATELFDDVSLMTKSYTRFPRRPSYKEFNECTPRILTERPILKKGIALPRYLSARRNALEFASRNITEKKLNELIDYLYDFSVSKDPVDLMNYGYSRYFLSIKKNFKFKNILSIYQNIHDVFFLLSRYDHHHHTAFTLSLMKYYLDKKFIHFNGIDGWESKRLYNLFKELAISHHCSDSVKIFVECLSSSPSRSAAFISFNLTPYYFEEIGLANVVPYPDLAIPEEAPYKYLAENLDIKYFNIYDLNKRIEYVRNIVRQFAPNIEYMIKDCIKYSMASEFNSFSYNFEQMLECIMYGKKETPSAHSLEIILEDFYRCQITQKYKKLVERANIGPREIDYQNPETDLYRNQIRVKRELLNIKVNTFNFLDSCKKIFALIGDKRLEQKVEEFKQDYVNTTKPSLLPKPIPAYIKNEYSSDSNNI